MAGVRTRSSKVDQPLDDDVKGESDKETIGSILNPLREKLTEVFTLISDIEKRFDERFNRHDKLISNLLTRIEYLESRSEYSIHLANLNKRKIDDSEQQSKKSNLLIEGIPVERNENPTKLLEKIKAHISSFCIGIPDHAYDLCHRVGRRHTTNIIKKKPVVEISETPANIDNVPDVAENSETSVNINIDVPDISVETVVHQSILLKLSYRCFRHTIYYHRKMFTEFKVFPQLTNRRRDILFFAKDEIRNNYHENVHFVYADKNCKLKLRTNSGRFFGFNSNEEFLSLLTWFHQEESFNDFDKYARQDTY